MSCIVIAFSLVNQAKTRQESSKESSRDGDAFLAGTYLKARYVNNATSDDLKCQDNSTSASVRERRKIPDKWSVHSTQVFEESNGDD